MTHKMRRTAAMLAATCLVTAAGPATALAGGDGTNQHVRFGTTVFRQSGESYHDAFLRQQRTYGPLGAVRMFFPGLPGSWESIRNNVGDTRVIVSFKAPPAAVVAGDYDDRLRQWFKQAPQDRVTRWSYWHEPEDDISAGRFGPRMYRSAWRHINSLAQRAANPKLRSTLVLMCWTLEAGSHRNWRDYYPGNEVIDGLAFDCYNAGYDDGRYRTPDDLFSSASRLAHRVGKPWGITELGSRVATGDDGSGRAAWLRDVARYLRNHDARFCTYFDSDVGVDFRLHDQPSQTAWSGVIQDQWS